MCSPTSCRSIPGRAVSIVRKNAHLIGSLVLAGYSYSYDGADLATGPGIAEYLVERRNGIADDVLGWEPAKDAHGNLIGGVMQSHTLKSGVTEWRARDIPIPSTGGPHRLYIAQYEVVPTDRRASTTATTASAAAVIPQATARRLLHQDVIPL